MLIPGDSRVELEGACPCGGGLEGWNDGGRKLSLESLRPDFFTTELLTLTDSSLLTSNYEHEESMLSLQSA